MKKACVIISSMVGGAVVGSIVALLAAPKSGRELRSDIYEVMMDKMNILHDQVKKYGCNCESKVSMQDDE